MKWLLLAALVLGVPAHGERYSYDNCINATMLWCRHQRDADGQRIDQPTCVGHNARPCADCVTYRYLQRSRNESGDDLGPCGAWLDGTVVRSLREGRDR